MGFKTKDEYKLWYNTHYKKARENMIECICGKKYTSYTSSNHFKSKHHKQMQEIIDLKKEIEILKS